MDLKTIKTNVAGILKCSEVGLDVHINPAPGRNGGKEGTELFLRDKPGRAGPTVDSDAGDALPESVGSVGDTGNSADFDCEGEFHLSNTLDYLLREGWGEAGAGASALGAVGSSL